MTPGLSHDLMRTFVAVADCGGFRAASDRVNRTPSAVSMQMAKLEEDIGCPLFVKTGRNMALSAAGEELLGYARRILDLSEEAVERLRGRTIDGHVRFGVPDDRGTRLLPSVLARFARAYPNVVVEVVLAPSRILIDRLSRNDIDLVVVSDTPQSAAMGGEIIYREPLVWIGRTGGVARERTPLPLSMAEPGCQWRELAIEALDAAGVPHRIAVTSDHSWGQLAAVNADLAVAPLPLTLLGPGLERIEGVLPDLGYFEDRMCIGPTPSRAVLALGEALRESLQ